ncbi:MAG TPA: GPP34 family phosphoprotein [Nocardioidaceae bacterium]|nr:GPP34 family phosphoprotein [Nocardioidaceae bacterium]
MTITEDLLLVTIDPETGRCAITSTAAQRIVGGAILTDLVLVGRMRLDGDGRRARVEVIDGPPVDDRLLSAALGRIGGRRLRPKDIVMKLGKGGLGPVRDHLAATGQLDLNYKGFLGVKYSWRYVGAGGRREALVRGVRGVLIDFDEPDETTGPLVALLASADLLRAVVSRDEHKRAKARAKEVSEGDWAADGVRAAIKAARDAAAVMAVTAATAGAIGAS